jgi:hypothetical protein
MQQSLPAGLRDAAFASIQYFCHFADRESRSDSHVPGMKTRTTKQHASGNVTTGGDDDIDRYATAQSPKNSAICHALRAEIDAALPTAASKVWHGSPVWFIGENPVVGYNVTLKHVNLLFWSGQSFGEPALKAVGKFAAAQTQFTDLPEIDTTTLRRWLKKASTEIFDYHGHLAAQRARRAKANP